jgi:hypothetical protein
MWNGQTTQKLTGMYKDVFLMAVKSMFEDLTDGYIVRDKIIEALNDKSSNTLPGYRLFKKMSKNQKVVCLAYVCRYLTNDEKAPELLAWNEATIASVFKYLQTELELDIDGHSTVYKGRTVRSYLQELAKLKYEHIKHEYPDELDAYNEPPDVDSEDMNIWNDIVEDLTERILWDLDFDWDNSVSNCMEKDNPENYFSGKPPKVTDDSLNEALDYFLDLFKLHRTTV